MTRAEYNNRMEYIMEHFDFGDISEEEYYRQIGELAAKFGEEYEEEL